MRKYWLLFAQATTVALAVLFIINTLKPGLLPTVARGGVVTLYENAVSNNDSAIPNVGFSAAAQKVMPAVVNIFTRTEVKTAKHPFMDDPRFRYFFGDQFDEDNSEPSSSLGSGVIVSHDGYILTNHHVIEEADQIEVALADGRNAKGHIVGSDPDTDLAVIKIDLPGNLPQSPSVMPNKRVSATSSSPSAIPSAWVKRLPWASSAHSSAITSA